MKYQTIIPSFFCLQTVGAVLNGAFHAVRFFLFSKSHGAVRCGFNSSRIVRCGAVRCGAVFSLMACGVRIVFFENRTVRCGVVIR